MQVQLSSSHDQSSCIIHKKTAQRPYKWYNYYKGQDIIMMWAQTNDNNKSVVLASHPHQCWCLVDPLTHVMGTRNRREWVNKFIIQLIPLTFLDFVLHVKHTDLSILVKSLDCTKILNRTTRNLISFLSME